jgi:hypothetical protein
MALRRTYQRVVILVVVGIILIALGIGHSMVSVLKGMTVGDDVLQQGVLKQQQQEEQNMLNAIASTTTQAPADKSDAKDSSGKGEDDLSSAAPLTKAPPHSVWNFTHRSSASNAVMTVRGLPIEGIHPYLKKKSGGRWIGIHPNDLKISPLLPKVEGSVVATSKLVFMDLGARMYPGSTGWFLKHYPRSREFHVVVFELLDLENTYTAAKPYFKSFTYERKAAWTHSNGVAIKGMRMARVDDNVVVQKGDNRPTWLSPSVDVASYILSNFTKEDFVVLKLDIEGGEWTLIPHLVRTGAMELIDEVFFECHPIDFDDYQKQPNRLPSICVDFINDLRAMGVYCHRWF